MDLSGKNILVTGGSGFIGTSVVRSLTKLGAQVKVADRVIFPAGSAPAPVAGVVGDLEDPAVRDKAVTADLDGIIHLAAVTSVLKSMADPAGTYRANVEVTQGLLELARERGVERFLMSSTNAVVGDIGGETIREDVPLRPLTPYGSSKAAGEMLLSGYAGSYGMATCALRLTNVYGPGMGHKDSFIPRLMRAALAGEGVRVYGDGSQSRDFVHVEDVVQALLVAWKHRHAGSIIVGSGVSVSVLELIEAVRRATGCPVPVEHVPAQAGEMPAVIVDIARARRLGYEPELQLDRGLGTVWEDWNGVRLSH